MIMLNFSCHLFMSFLLFFHPTEAASEIEPLTYIDMRERGVVSTVRLFIYVIK